MRQTENCHHFMSASEEAPDSSARIFVISTHRCICPDKVWLKSVKRKLKLRKTYALGSQPKAGGAGGC
jgi:hypothetical protein